MKILHITSDLSPFSGGPVSVVRGLSQAQIESGHKVTIASTDYQYDKNFFEKIHIRVSHCEFIKWRWASGFRFLIRPFVEEADIIHLHSVWDYPILAGALEASKQKRPYILSACGMLDPWPLSQKTLKKKIYLALFGRYLFNKNAHVHFTTEEEKDGARPYIKGASNFVVPLGVPKTAYESLPPREDFFKRFPVLKHKRIILFLGRFHSVKQPELIMGSFKHIHDKDSSFCLVMAGAGNPDYEKSLKKLAHQLKIKNAVFFTGFLNEGVVQEAFRAADVFILPSLHENFGLAIVEAMAAGCPVVVSPRVHLAERIVQANAGLVCNFDEDSVISALWKLIKDDRLRKDMGKNAAQFVIGNFTWEKVNQKMLTEYEKIIRGKYSHKNP